MLSLCNHYKACSSNPSPASSLDSVNNFELSEPLTPHAFAIAVVFHKRNGAKQMHYYWSTLSPWERDNKLFLLFGVLKKRLREKVAFAF